MSACAAVREQLAWFVGGDLSQSVADGLREHLIACRSCRSEAAALQQATSALRGIGQVPVGGVDDDMFAAMHRTIVTAVAEIDTGAERRHIVRRWAVAAAAVLLAAVGFWLGHGDDGPSVWRRPPLTPVGFDDEPAIVVPYAGPRVELRKLGEEWWPEWAEDAPGQAGMSGMMGRRRLRSLVDERMLLPDQQQPPR